MLNEHAQLFAQTGTPGLENIVSEGLIGLSQIGIALTTFATSCVKNELLRGTYLPARNTTPQNFLSRVLYGV